MKFEEFVENHQGEKISVGAACAFLFFDVCDESTIQFGNSFLIDCAAAIEKNIEIIDKRLASVGRARTPRLKREAVHVEELRTYLKHFKYIEDREVLAAYKSIEDSSVWIVKIEGIEQGKYWLKEEFDEDLKKGCAQ